MILNHYYFGQMKVSSTNIINHLSDAEAKWFAVYTKYKCEKYVSGLLLKKGIVSYLPLISVTKKYDSKVKRYNIPLINNYVFVKILKLDYTKVLETEYVYSFLKQRKHLISIPEFEIDVLKRVVGEIEDISVGNISFQEGDKVEIIAGNLTGLQGVLMQREGNHRFVVKLESIGLQLSMTVDKSRLKMIKKRVVSQVR